MPSDPISPYGLDKLAGETYCRLFTRLYGLPTVALRYFNVFGPRQDPASEYAAVIPRFMTAILAGKPPTIYGDGEQTRDFTFIANVVRRQPPVGRGAGERVRRGLQHRLRRADLAARPRRRDQPAGRRIGPPVPRRAPRRRHPALAGRDRQGPPAARLRAAGRPGGRAAPARSNNSALRMGRERVTRGPDRAVIIAGGGGTRLWPWTGPGLPKPLLPLGGGGRTLLAAGLDRLAGLVPPAAVALQAPAALAAAPRRGRAAPGAGHRPRRTGRARHGAGDRARDAPAARGRAGRGRGGPSRRPAGRGRAGVPGRARRGGRDGPRRGARHARRRTRPRQHPLRLRRGTAGRSAAVPRAVSRASSRSPTARRPSASSPAGATSGTRGSSSGAPTRSGARWNAQPPSWPARSRAWWMETRRPGRPRPGPRSTTR